MKSLLVTYDFPPIFSGISTLFYNIWKRLPPKDYSILAPKIKGYESLDRQSNLNIMRYFNFYNFRFFRELVLLFSIFIIIEREEIDMLFCGSPVSLGLIGFICKKIAKIPYVVFYYGGEFKKFKGNKIILRLLKKNLTNAKMIIAISHFSYQEVMSYGVDKDRVFIITPGVDTDIFKPDIDCTDLKKQLNLEGKKVLLTVSRMVKRKGIDTVIDALPEIKKEFPTITYLVVGCGKDEEYFKILAKQNTVEQNVIFVGKVSDKELPQYYNLCDIYVMPNRETHGEETIEGFGISFIEASSSGKPVIGGESGGTQEAIDDGLTGILVDSSNNQELAAAILKLLKDENLAKRLGQNGRHKAERDFRWDIIVNRFKNLFQTQG